MTKLFSELSETLYMQYYACNIITEYKFECDISVFLKANYLI